MDIYGIIIMEILIYGIIYDCLWNYNLITHVWPLKKSLFHWSYPHIFFTMKSMNQAAKKAVSYPLWHLKTREQVGVAMGDGENGIGIYNIYI